MSYVRLDDRLPHHRKVRALPPRLALAAFGLYTAGLTFAQAHKTDGRVLVDDLPEVMPVAPAPQRRQCARELERVGLWDAHPEGGWVIHDYLDWNASAAKRTEKAKVAADARWDAHRNASNMLGASPPDCSPDASSAPLPSAPLKEKPPSNPRGEVHRAAPVPPGGSDGLSTNRTDRPEEPEPTAADVPATAAETKARLAELQRRLAVKLTVDGRGTAGR